MNASLEEYLWHYVFTSHKNWVDLLDTAQLRYNLHRSLSAGRSPFELATGQQPLTHEFAKQNTEWDCPAAFRFVWSKHELLEEAKDRLTKATKRMKKVVDKGRSPLEFQNRD